MVDPVAKIQEANETVGAEEKMAVDAGPRQFSAKTMQNEHGNYPKWMHKGNLTKRISIRKKEILNDIFC